MLKPIFPSILAPDVRSQVGYQGWKLSPRKDVSPPMSNKLRLPWYSLSVSLVTHIVPRKITTVIVTFKFPTLSVSLSPLRFPVTFKSLQLTDRQMVMTDIACTVCGTISAAGHDDFRFDDDKCQHVLCGSTCMRVHQLAHHSVSRIDWLRFCCGVRLPLRYEFGTQCEFLGIAEAGRRGRLMFFHPVRIYVFF